METIYFILGMLSVAVGYTAGSMFKLSKGLNEKMKDVIKESTQDDISNLYIELQNVERELNHRIDGEIRRTDSMVDEIHRTIDSRVDKLSNNISSTIANMYTELHKD